MTTRTSSPRFLAFGPALRRVIYTTDSIEWLNYQNDSDDGTGSDGEHNNSEQRGDGHTGRGSWGAPSHEPPPF